MRYELFNIWDEKTIDEALLVLQNLGFIKLIENLNPFYQTKTIRFFPEACNIWIRKHYDDQGKYLGIPQSFFLQAMNTNVSQINFNKTDAIDIALQWSHPYFKIQHHD